MGIQLRMARVGLSTTPSMQNRHAQRSVARCEHRIRGNITGNGYFSFETPPNPGFCDICGHLFPWATRSEKIFELENRLDSEDIEADDRSVIKKGIEQIVEP